MILRMARLSHLPQAPRHRWRTSTPTWTTRLPASSSSPPGRIRRPCCFDSQRYCKAWHLSTSSIDNTWTSRHPPRPFECPCKSRLLIFFLLCVHRVLRNSTYCPHWSTVERSTTSFVSQRRRKSPLRCGMENRTQSKRSSISWMFWSGLAPLVAENYDPILSTTKY